MAKKLTEEAPDLAEEVRGGQTSLNAADRKRLRRRGPQKPQAPSKAARLAEVRRRLEERPTTSARSLSTEFGLKVEEVRAVGRQIEADQKAAAALRWDAEHGHQSQDDDEPAWKRLKAAGGPPPTLTPMAIAPKPWAASPGPQGSNDGPDDGGEDERRCPTCGRPLP
jgi:hypothetical protein